MSSPKKQKMLAFTQNIAFTGINLGKQRKGEIDTCKMLQNKNKAY
jgi:hypothetical protein